MQAMAQCNERVRSPQAPFFLPDPQPFHRVRCSLPTECSGSVPALR